MTSSGPRCCKCLILIEAAISICMSVGSMGSSSGLKYQLQTKNDNRPKGFLYDTKGDTCPESCSCRFSVSPIKPVFDINCVDRNLLQFPSPLPKQTQVLNMSNNHLQNLTSLPPLPELRELDLSFNWLRYVDNKWIFEYSPQLRVLRLSNNALRNLQHGSFSGLLKLEILDLSGNILRSLDTHALGGLHELKVLRLDRNQFFHLSREWFMALTSLIELHISHNHIAVLDERIFDRLIHLQHLDLSYNALQLVQDDAFTGLTNLRLLNLSGNGRMKSIPRKALKSFSNLDILLLDGTTFSRMPPLAFTGLNIVEISISFCKNLRVLEKHSFYNMPRLLTLQIHDNPKLIFIHPSAFSSLPSLRHLLLHNNRLIAVPSQISQLVPSLIDLHLHHNPFHCDCNTFWLRQTLGKHNPQHSHKNIVTPLSILNSNNSNSSKSFNQNNIAYVDKLEHVTISHSSTSASNLSTSTIPSIYDHPHQNKKTTTTVSSTTTQGNAVNLLVREADRVACFFPDSLQTRPSSLPMVQIPLEYFDQTCPPSALPLFPSTLNITLGEDLILECQGLGIPTPQISWILPGGMEITSTSSVQTTTVRESKPFRRTHSPQVVDETLLRVPAVRLTDSGTYGCKVANSLGQEFSSVLVYVVNKPLELIGVEVGNDFITVRWRGSIRRMQMVDFQLFFRDMTVAPQHELQWTAGDDGLETDDGLDLHADYKVISLHGSIHKCTIRDLKPHTKYQVCLVYKKTHLVMCKEWTTLQGMPLVRASPGIVKVSLTQIVAAIVSVIGVILLTLLVVTLVRRRHRGDYHGPGNEEKTNIPLEGLLPTTTSPCLTSSRTALLSNSHV